ncbi:ATP-dependent helicase HrpB [Paenibacillus crassostreae]|uniref:ATP-dependent helicase n=1 Tax=Paenibacillus crassostreae TaxID=1763538 RepID=A0A167FJU5_9BACL|nr:ATP-dependent helicase HrpB [Paenibacillus crassostreae]AOZ94328.1 ATP-dependent helicase HrpB [Paenibacillus crassostreae]OAB76634.1 ATP-dependent helicase [Paenibacillus crassostreae]
MHDLPIYDVLPQLKKQLKQYSSAVLIAEPGAGKTTRVPLALLDEPWLQGKKIIMLEPRRLAARSAAQFMATQLGERVGETVGYRVRMDSRIGKTTRIEVVTEGVLTRMLQHDQELANVGILIFDEFHERNIHGDLGLALALESQSMLREDLRILVMSATLEAEPVASLLQDAPIIHCHGRQFPVDTIYVPQPVNSSTEKAMASTINLALLQHEGNVLAFLPGVGEIRKVKRELEMMPISKNTVIRTLYGQLSLTEQDAAIHPEPDGRRKIVLATSIAETSLTIEGIRIVVDSGLSRTQVLSKRSGMSHLMTVKGSKASADQRRGRAGRTQSGICYRLWSHQEQDALKEARTPEILSSDLTSLALEIAAWGIQDPKELRWLDRPSEVAFTQAVELLKALKAVDVGGRITVYGREMLNMGIHPRMAHMVLKAIPLHCGYLACLIAALLQERDIFKGNRASENCDIQARIDYTFWRKGKQLPSLDDSTIDEAAIQRVIQETRNIQRQASILDESDAGVEWSGVLLSFAYPDRIGQCRGDGRFLLSSGRGVELSKLQPLSHSTYIVAAVVDDRGTEGRLQLAASISESSLYLYQEESIQQRDMITWDRDLQGVKARRRWMLGNILLKERPFAKPPEEDIAYALLDGIRQEGLQLLPWNKVSIQYRQRLQFMHMLVPSDWPEVTDEALLATLQDWMLLSIYGMKNRNDLQRLQLTNVIEQNLLSWEQRRELDQKAPTHMNVPSGSRIPIDYSDPLQPIVAVRLQEMFGLEDTPRIGGGRVPLTLHLLSPAQRPVQVTSDLASFWRGAYFEVKKDLKGRYPKHYWPDEPLEASATRRVRQKNRETRIGDFNVTQRKNF